MLTFFKQIFVWWNQTTFGTRIKTIFLENLLEKTHLEINIIKINLEKDGLFIKMKLMHQKFQTNGTHGCTLQKIKLKTFMI